MAAHDLTAQLKAISARASTDLLREVDLDAGQHQAVGVAMVSVAVQTAGVVAAEVVAQTIERGGELSALLDAVLDRLTGSLDGDVRAEVEDVRTSYRAALTNVRLVIDKDPA